MPRGSRDAKLRALVARWKKEPTAGQRHARAQARPVSPYPKTYQDGRDDARRECALMLADALGTVESAAAAPTFASGRFGDYAMVTAEAALAANEEDRMQFGVYRKLKGRTGVGMLYQFLLLARHHTTGAEYVVYVPLRVEPEWAGTLRPCILERAAFDERFAFVSEGLPSPVDRQ